MQIVNSDLFTSTGPNQVILVTTNQTLRRDGDLVMGAGAAKQASLRVPGLATWLGSYNNYKSVTFGKMTSDGTMWGCFPTKHDWKHPSDIELIRKSADQLCRYAADMKDLTFHCNFPGIGLGQLKYEDVLEVLTKANLPDNVFFHVK